MAEDELSECDWHVVWGEVLDDEARRRVKSAIWHGHALGDPDEAAVAIERALRQRRAVKWSVLANVLLGMLLVSVNFFLADPPASL